MCERRRPRVLRSMRTRAPVHALPSNTVARLTHPPPVRSVFAVVGIFNIECVAANTAILLRSLCGWGDAAQHIHSLRNGLKMIGPNTGMNPTTMVDGHRFRNRANETQVAPPVSIHRLRAWATFRAKTKGAVAGVALANGPNPTGLRNEHLAPKALHYWLDNPWTRIRITVPPPLCVVHCAPPARLMAIVAVRE